MNAYLHHRPNRFAKRVVSYVDRDLWRAILWTARELHIPIAQQIRTALAMYFQTLGVDETKIAQIELVDDA